MMRKYNHFFEKNKKGAPKVVYFNKQRWCGIDFHTIAVISGICYKSRDW